MNVVITFIWNGLMFGIRHFEPDKIRPYFELHIYLIFFQLTIFIDNRK